MFKRLMVPVDLAHAERLDRALRCAADLARHYGATIIHVAVAPATPGPLGHSPAEFTDRLRAFATSHGEAAGVPVESLALTSHDPAVDLDATLLGAVEETRADLVVMASHIPNLADHLWPSNGGTIAKRAGISVMIVR